MNFLKLLAEQPSVAEQPPVSFSSSSSSSRHSFNTEDLVSAPNLELGCAVILHNCASDYIQTVLVV